MLDFLESFIRIDFEAGFEEVDLGSEGREVSAISSRISPFGRARVAARFVYSSTVVFSGLIA